LLMLAGAGGGALLLIIGLIVVLFIAVILFSNTGVLSHKKVAVVYINGELTVFGSPPSMFSQGRPGSHDIVKTIKELDKRKDIGAVVFVFNSPGGDVVASREIYEAIKHMHKPTVAYFESEAASGAYYAACGTDYIVSNPDAITGSIGVIAEFVNYRGLMNKIGVNITPIKSGANKDIGAPYKPLTPQQKKLLQGVVDQVYHQFKQVVIDSRGSKLNMTLFQNLSDGRFVTGMQAKKIGLVDQIGSEQDAIDEAAKLAHIKGKPEVVTITPGQNNGGLFDFRSFIAGLFRMDAPSSGVVVKYE